MKRAFRILPAIAAIAVGSMLVAAQDTETKPEMSLVIIEHVKPAMRMQYEDATKEMVSLLTDHKADPEQVGWFTVSGPEMGYAFIVPLEDGFSSMDTVRGNWMSTIESIGKDRWKKLAKKADACVESRSMVHSLVREDLSYIPKNPDIKEHEVEFAQYDYLYVRPDKTEEFEEMAKKWQALYAKHNISSGWWVYQTITGDDLPMYIIAKHARSEAEYYTNREKIHKSLGEEAEALGAKSYATVRKVESMAGYPRPELSYPNFAKMEE